MRWQQFCGTALAPHPITSKALYRTTLLDSKARLICPLPCFGRCVQAKKAASQRLSLGCWVLEEIPKELDDLVCVLLIKGFGELDACAALLVTDHFGSLGSRPRNNLDNGRPDLLGRGLCSGQSKENVFRREALPLIALAQNVVSSGDDLGFGFRDLAMQCRCPVELDLIARRKGIKDNAGQLSNLARLRNVAAIKAECICQFVLAAEDGPTCVAGRCQLRHWRDGTKVPNPLLEWRQISAAAVLPIHLHKLGAIIKVLDDRVDRERGLKACPMAAVAVDDRVPLRVGARDGCNLDRLDIATGCNNLILEKGEIL